jgi:hypothetical protein
VTTEDAERVVHELESVTRAIVSDRAAFVAMFRDIEAAHYRLGDTLHKLQQLAEREGIHELF